MANIGILGAGTWGTALGNMLSNEGKNVTIWSKFESEAELLRTTRKHKNLPSAKLNEGIIFTSHIEEAIKNKDIVIFAVPSPFIRDVANKAKPFINNQVFVSVAKGIENPSLFTTSEVLQDVLGKDIKVVALSGPTHAEEVAIGLPTTIVSACKDHDVAKYVQEELSSPFFRIYTNTDIVGVEVCGAVKNIIALAAGMLEGVGYGDNAKAALITRGLTELVRLGKAMGCNDSTFYGLTGIGDIVVTCTSKFSRNHNAGVYLGQGYSIKETLEKVGMVVEGLNALDSTIALKTKYNVEMPIVEAVYSVVHNGVNVSDAVKDLFTRKQRAE